MSSIGAMLDACDIDAAPGVRLDGIRALLEEACARPIPAPRWAVLQAAINAELARRAEVDGRPAQAVFKAEIEVAIALASPIAKARAARAFAKTFEIEIRREVGDLLCDSLLGDWRHLTVGIEELEEVQAPGADPVDAAHAEHLLNRLTALADLTDNETEVLRTIAVDGGGTAAQRKALQRARDKLRATIHERF